MNACTIWLSFKTLNNSCIDQHYGKIRSALDKNEISCGIFVDLQKAFDTANHEILLDKLNFYGLLMIGSDHIYMIGNRKFV